MPSLRWPWLEVGAFRRRDPTLFVLSFAAWSFCNGLSLLLTNDTFHRTAIYSVAVDLGLDDNFVGAGMIANAAALLFVIGRTSYQTRATVLFGSAGLWFFWGAITGVGGWRIGFYSAAALWDSFGAAALVLLAANRWEG